MFRHMQCGCFNDRVDRGAMKRSDSCCHSVYKLGKNVTPVSRETYEKHEVHEYAGRFEKRRKIVEILCGPGLLTSGRAGQHT
jgi:hypothetical protein